MKPARLIATRLSKEGFGTPLQILQMPVGIVIDALHYSNFLGDYERTFANLNKDSSP